MYYKQRFLELRSYSFALFQADLLAGLIVALVALPLAMSFAIAIGVNPEYGLYAAIIGGVIAALFGGSEVNVTGPTGAFVPVLGGIVLTFGYDGLLVAGILAGIMLFSGGVFKLGTLISYIPYPVTIGFTTGIAVIIFASQLGNILGLTGLERHEYFHKNILEVVSHMSGFNIWAFLIAVLTIVVMVLLPRLHRRIPAALFAVIIAAIVTVVFKFDIATIQSVFGGIPQALPSFHVPAITFGVVIDLLPAAFAIAMLGAIESLLSCVVSDSMTRKQHNSNAELIGQGISNMVTPLFGGIPVTGAIARTAVNVKSGAQTRFASIFHALFLLAIMLLLAPLVNYIPLAALGGVLAVVSYRMAELPHVYELMKHGDRTDVLVLFTTFLLTVFVNLTVSIPIGLGLAAIIFLKRMSELGLVPTEIDRKGDEPRFVPSSGQQTCEHISLYTIQGPLFFGAARKFVTLLQRSDVQKAGAIVLRMKHVPLIDATGLNALREIFDGLKNRNIYLSGVQPQVREAIKKSELDSLIGEGRMFSNTREAISSALKNQGLEHGCEDYKVI